MYFKVYFLEGAYDNIARGHMWLILSMAYKCTAAAAYVALLRLQNLSIRRHLNTKSYGVWISHKLSSNMVLARTNIVLLRFDILRRREIRQMFETRLVFHLKPSRIYISNATWLFLYAATCSSLCRSINLSHFNY